MKKCRKVTEQSRKNEIALMTICYTTSVVDGVLNGYEHN